MSYDSLSFCRVRLQCASELSTDYTTSVLFESSVIEFLQLVVINGIYLKNYNLTNK